MKNESKNWIRIDIAMTFSNYTERGIEAMSNIYRHNSILTFYVHLLLG